MPALFRIAGEVAVTFTRPRHSRRTQLFKTAEKLFFNEHPFISAPLKNCGKPGKKFIWHFGWLWSIKSSDQMKWTDLVWAVDLSLLSVRWISDYCLNWSRQKLVLCTDPSVKLYNHRAWAFSWLKAATTAFIFKTLLRHYAKRALTPRSLNVKLGPRRKGHKGWAVWLA